MIFIDGKEHQQSGLKENCFFPFKELMNTWDEYFSHPCKIKDDFNDDADDSVWYL